MNREGILEHKEAFDAWLEGAEIRGRVSTGGYPWYPINNPEWLPDWEYEVIPQRQTQTMYANIYTDPYMTTRMTDKLIEAMAKAICLSMSHNSYERRTVGDDVYFEWELHTGRAALAAIKEQGYEIRRIEHDICIWKGCNNEAVPPRKVCNSHFDKRSGGRR